MPYIIHTKDKMLSMGVTPTSARKSMKTKGDPFYKNPSAYEKELQSAKTTYVSKHKLAKKVREYPDTLFGFNDMLEFDALSEAKKNRRRRIGKRNSKRR